jgi:hypothetical protein
MQIDQNHSKSNIYKISTNIKLPEMKKLILIALCITLLAACAGKRSEYKTLSVDIPAGLQHNTDAVEIISQYQQLVNEVYRINARIRDISGVEGEDISLNEQDLPARKMARISLLSLKFVDIQMKLEELDKGIAWVGSRMSNDEYVLFRDVLMLLDQDMGRFAAQFPNDESEQGGQTASSESQGENSLQNNTSDQINEEPPAYPESEQEFQPAEEQFAESNSFHEPSSASTIMGEMTGTVLMIIFVFIVFPGIVIFFFFRKVKKLLGSTILQNVSHSVGKIKGGFRQASNHEFMSDPNMPEEEKKKLKTAKSFFTGTLGIDLEDAAVDTTQEPAKPGSDLDEGTLTSAENLRSLFDNELKDSLLSLEKQRKGARLYYLFAIVSAGLCWASVSLPDNQGILTIVAITIFFLAVFGFFIAGTMRFFKYRNMFKKQVTSKLVKLINPHFIYHPDRHITLADFNKSSVINQVANACQGDDYVCGKLDKTVFEFSELVAKYEEEYTDDDGKKATRTKELFNGLFFLADFNKHIQGETFVVPDNSERLLGRLGQSIQVSHKGELVKLENPEFEKYFAVFSTSQVEARYILSTRMMEAMVNIRKKLGCSLRFSFLGERVYCAISFKKPLFEPSIMKPVQFADIEFMHTLFELIDLIIREMNLNRRIWTKE